MQAPPREPRRNQLLSTIPADDYGTLCGLGEVVPLQRRDVLIGPDRIVTDILFLFSGVASETAIAPDGRRIEVGIVGREGFVGVPILFDVDATPHEISVLVAGEALRIDAAAFRTFVAEHPETRRQFLRYAHIYQIQTAETAVANGVQTLEARLARWLLMCHDRTRDDEVSITHESLSVMLGVRRPGVTTALHVLEGDGMIRGRRSHIQVLDREKLTRAAGGSYGVAEREYRRLIDGAA